MAAYPQTKPVWAVGLPLSCYHPHPSLPLISITQPKSW